MNLIDIPEFIKTHITKRPTSLFEKDIDANKEVLSKKIAGK